jgi:hypothetical protein
LVITFSENVAFTSLAAQANVQLIDLSNSNSLTAASVTVLGDVLTINPTVDLVAGHNYAVTIADGTLQDDAGVILVGWTDATTYDFIAGAVV